MKKYVNQIVTWYQSNKRDLPWRQDKDPYHVWISEIMLQQTRIEAVIPYYQHFIEEIPNIKSLATIEETRLLKLWEGLGYYSRARNLKKAATLIQTAYSGNFPTTYVEILKLPGIGEYTASAIASICFNEKEVTIDGNVLRVYTRFYNDPRNIDDPKVKKEIRANLSTIIPKESGDFNQGLMEIGETICLPNGQPKCNLCPLKHDCQAYAKNTYSNLPVRSPKISKKEENYTLLIYQFQNQYAIYQRTDTTLLKNLWAFPHLSGNLSKSSIEKYLTKELIHYSKVIKGPTYTHIFTHKKWHMTSFIIFLDSKDNIPYSFYTIKEIETTHAMATAYKPFLQDRKESEEK